MAQAGGKNPAGIPDALLQKKQLLDRFIKDLCPNREIYAFFPNWKKVVDVRKKYDIIYVVQ